MWKAVRLRFVGALLISHCATVTADPFRFVINHQPIFGSFAYTWDPEDLRQALDTGMNLVFCYDRRAGAKLLDPHTEMGALLLARGAKVMSNMGFAAGGKYLAEDVDAVATEIQLNFRSDREGPGTFWLGKEAVRFKRCRAGRLLGCERGWANTTPTAHRRGLFVVHEEPLREEILRRKDSPNLWGYWIMDDKKGNQLDALRNAYRIIKETDVDANGQPNPHVIVAGMANPEALANFGAGVCDLVGIYIYPSKRGAFDCTLAATRLKQMLPSIEGRSAGTPFMGIYQAFTGGHFTPKPTPLQVRKQVLDFCHFGASALMAYSWRMIRGHKALRDLPELRQEVRRIGDAFRAGRIKLDRPTPSYPERRAGPLDALGLVPVLTFRSTATPRLSARPGVSIKYERGPDRGCWLHMNFEEYTAGGPQWPTVRIAKEAMDNAACWLGAGWLAARIHNFMAEESEIGVTVRDSRGGPYWARYFPLPAKRTTYVCAPLARIGETVDLSDVSLVTLLMRRPRVATHLAVGGEYLAPRKFARVEGIGYLCPKTPRPPNLDGSPLDRCWNDAPMARLRDETLALPPMQPVSLRVVHASYRLYVLLECAVHDPRGLRISHGENKRWEATDDTVEVFVRSPRTARWIRHVANAAGSTSSRLFRGLASSSAAESVETASRLVAEKWIVEMAFDLRRLEDEGVGPLGFNVCRHDRQLGPLVWAKDDALPLGIEPLGTLALVR